MATHHSLARPETPLDGRRARTDRSRDLILSGLRELLARGEVHPTAEEVAQFAGVSPRSIFRIFDGIEGLLVALDRHEHASAAQSFRPCPLDAPVEDRVRSFLGNCVRLYEQVAPVRRALERYESSSPDLKFYRERQQRVARQKIEVVFAPELEPLSRADRSRALEGCSALTSWVVWNELRAAQRMPARATRVFLERQLLEVLRPTAGPPLPR